MAIPPPVTSPSCIGEHSVDRHSGLNGKSGLDAHGRHGALMLCGVTTAIFVFFIANEQGYLLPYGGRALTLGLAIMGAAAVGSVLLHRTLRVKIAMTSIATLVVAVPIDRINGVDTATIELYVIVVALFGLVGCTALPSRFTQQTMTLVTILLGVWAGSTIVAGSSSGILRLSLSLVPAGAAILLAGRLDERGKQQLSIVVVFLAAIESVIAILEPILFANHSVSAQIQPDGTLVATKNTLLFGFQRSQGTLGHALPLGLLLMLGLTLLLRVVVPRWWVKWPVTVLFGVAVVFAGSRSSVLIGLVLVLFFPSHKLGAARLTSGVLTVNFLLLLGVITNFLNTPLLDRLYASGSYTHRAGVFNAFEQLLSRQSLFHTVVGNGFGSIPSLFARGLLQTDGFNVVDNQFVSALAQGGLVTMVCLAVFVVRPIFAIDWRWRGTGFVVLVNCMVFDWFSWTSSAVLVGFALGCAFSSRETAAGTRTYLGSTGGEVARRVPSPLLSDRRGPGNR